MKTRSYDEGPDYSVDPAQLRAHVLVMFFSLLIPLYASHFYVACGCALVCTVFMRGVTFARWTGTRLRASVIFVCLQCACVTRPASVRNRMDRKNGHAFLRVMRKIAVLLALAEVLEKSGRKTQTLPEKFWVFRRNVKPGENMFSSQFVSYATFSDESSLCSIGCVVVCEKDVDDSGIRPQTYRTVSWLLLPSELNEYAQRDNALTLAYIHNILHSCIPVCEVNTRQHTSMYKKKTPSTRSPALIRFTTRINA